MGADFPSRFDDVVRLFCKLIVNDLTDFESLENGFQHLKLCII